MIRVLVADDEELERRALLQILGGAAHPEPLHIAEAVNGLEALEAVRADPPDIAFLDIHMPGIDGLEVARSLSATPEPPEIVMITAYDQFSYAQTALRFGVREYLLKPAASADVLAALETSIRAVLARRKERELRLAARGIAEDLKATLRDRVSASLRRGELDEAELSRLTALVQPRRAWVGIAISSGMRTVRAPGAAPSIAARAFPRAFLALAERFLAEDLGLEPQDSWLIAQPHESDEAPASTQRAREPGPAHADESRVNALLLLFAEENGAGGDARALGQTQELLARAEDIARSRIGAFYRRCLGSTIGRLQIGLSAAPPERLADALAAARTALDLSNERMPVLALRPIPPSCAAENGIAESAGGGALPARALSWLREHFMEIIGIESAAAALGVSPSHLSRALTRELGMSFGETLARMRIARAKSLLASGLSAKEASFLVGFRDQSYFTKVFLKFEGVLPSQYSA